MGWIKRLFRRRTGNSRLPSKTRNITKADIAGARVIDIHASFKDLDGYDCTTIYFTVNRGFSFVMPVAGYIWKTEDVPRAAERVPDEYDSGSEIVKRIKQQTIQGMYCLKMDQGLGFYCPDDAIMLFEDGSQAYCITVAPHGLGATGLHYQTDADRLRALSELVDFFEIPPGQGLGAAGAIETPE